MGKHKNDGNRPFDERLIEAGLDALAAGDIDGASEALRVAEQIREAHTSKEDEKKRR